MSDAEDESANFYFTRFAAAYVRGTPGVRLPPALMDRPLAMLSPGEMAEIIRAGRAAGLRLHRFKRTMGLRRVERVIGVLRGLSPENLLDVGSGRGAFLWPLLDAMPDLPVTCIDVLNHRVRDLETVRRGGVDRLTVLRMDAARMTFPPAAFDGVTFLETLEHIPDAAAAVAVAVRVARRFVIASVPSKPDDNPEHIHLFDEPTLRATFRRAGAANVNVQYVLNHMIAVARVG